MRGFLLTDSIYMVLFNKVLQTYKRERRNMKERYTMPSAENIEKLISPIICDPTFRRNVISCISTFYAGKTKTAEEWRDLFSKLLDNPLITIGSSYTPKNKPFWTQHLIDIVEALFDHDMALSVKAILVK